MITLLMTSGRYSGELREFPFIVARELLADGRAIRPEDEVPVVAAAPRKAGRFSSEAAPVNRKKK